MLFYYVSLHSKFCVVMSVTISTYCVVLCCVVFCFVVCLRPVFCVPYASIFSVLFILDFHFGCSLMFILISIFDIPDPKNLILLPKLLIIWLSIFVYFELFPMKAIP